MKTIAIIGAGFSGTMLAVQLMNHATTPFKILLVEKAEVGRGLAYKDIHPQLLLNVRADHIGAFPENIAHFHQWLLSRNISCGPSDFISRKIFGDYLIELLETAVGASKSLVDFEIIRDEVVEVESAAKKLLLKNGGCYAFDQLVLAIGLESPAEVDFKTIKNSREPITILGTGLSMADMVIYLHSINYEGQITAVSRRGKIPLPHKFYDYSIPRPVYDFSHDHSLLHALKTVKDNLSKFEWRLAIDSLRPHNQKLWKGWSRHERSQFLRYLRPFWDTHRHRISADHHKILTEMIKSQKLVIKTIGFKPFTPTTKTVIKCYGLSHAKNSFVQKLIAEKLVSQDEFQLGISSCKDWVHTIGPLRRGELWESTAVPEIRVQAKSLALSLLAAL